MKAERRHRRDRPARLRPCGFHGRTGADGGLSANVVLTINAATVLTIDGTLKAQLLASDFLLA
jgi:hypothetical protein